MSVSLKKTLAASPSRSRGARSLRSRRVIALMVTQAAVLIAFVGFQAIDRRLGRTAVYSGAMLLVCLILLALLGVRKRLPLGNWGSVSTWTQVHLYLGLFSLAAYAMHVPRVLADGWIEGPLSILFLGVAASGLYGIYASRTLPRRLTALGDEVRFDQFEFHRRQLWETAQGQWNELPAKDSADGSAVLRGFCQTRLETYFRRPPSWLRCVLDRSSARARLLQELRELDRYLDPEERSLSGPLAALIRRRDELDHQWVLQSRLRGWVVFHSLATLALVAMTLVHLWAVIGYTG